MAQENPVQIVIDRFEAGQFQSSLDHALHHLEYADSLSRIDRARLHQYAAYDLIALDRRKEARLHARETLTLIPELSLDPVYVSPKIIQVFDEVRQEMIPPVFEDPARTDTIPQTPTPVRVSEPEPVDDAAIQRIAFQRSLIVPGWGQNTLGHKRGTWLMATGAVCLSGLVTAHIYRNQAHDDYRNENDPIQIEDRYDTYKIWHRARTACAIATGVVWLYSLIDVSRIQVHPEIIADQELHTGIRLNYTF